MVRIEKLLRRFLAAVVTHDIWRIYSITDLCGQDFRAVGSLAKTTDISISEISDADLLNAPGIDPELSKANWYGSGAIGYAAWRGRTLAGVCWLWPGPLLGGRNVGVQKSDCAELIQITVSARHRGLGLAPALISHAVSRFGATGYRRLYAQIWHSNKASMKAFEKCGWVQVAWVFRITPARFLPSICYRRIEPAFRKQNDVLEGWRDQAGTL